MGNTTESTTTDPRARRRRGVIVVLAATMMIVFMATVAFSLDVSYMQLCKAKLRAATDAAARAAGEGLSRQQDIEYARQQAKDIAQLNHVAGAPLLLDDPDIIFGRSSQQANGAWAFTPEGSPVNAVRVFGRRTRDSLSGSVPIFFGRVFNVFDFEPIQAATVVRLDRDICLVVDRSSSMKLYLDDTSPTMSTRDSRFCQTPNMSQSRWGALSVAVQRFIDALEQTPQTEHVGLVSYGSNPIGGYCGYWSQADIDAPISEDHTVVTAGMQSISGKSFNGMTNIAAGILKGVDVLTSGNARPYAAKTMVLMSDGAYTEGVQPRQVAPQAAEQDIIIHTITFGEANPDEMQAIADATDGNHYIAPNAQRLQEIFEEIALTLPVVFTD
ncbi:von Willebrand factor type A domain protein [Posidoniimonas corsicana]|uniref:von Willebrand factor type A domain protein n=1 Tax=Posidoniimonas corsicana TaxID=1938618 RepID=A0A5C5VHB4_9BACT|nr:VWA domain-containing protein [Posidoniimonas corsicana]TWT37383.1 von Willebrand factor type A domain protein [Posidoniimonas corsicana]